MLELDTQLKIDHEVTVSPNLCDRFTDADLSKIGGEVWSGFQRDKNSRSDWEERMKAAMDLSMQIAEAKSFPWPGASNVVFPLITIAALQFSARSYTNIVQGNNVVKYRTIGKEATDVRERALRIGKHMSWQLLEQDCGWEEQTDKQLLNLSIIGANFKKTYYNPSKGYPTGTLVMAKDLYIDYFAESAESAIRKTHRFPLYRNEVRERMIRGTFKDYRNDPWFTSVPPVQHVDHARDHRSGVHPNQPDQKTPFHMLEQHVSMDFDGDGYEEPYIITIEESSHKVLRIVARWDRDEDIERIDGEIASIRAQEYFTPYTFIPSPDGGVYGLGFGIFLGPLNEAVNTSINQLLDAGTLQCSIGGFLGRGAKIRGGVYTMAPFEWKRVDSTGDDLRKNLVPFPDREPSDVLLKLLDLLINYAKQVAGTTDPVVGENPGQNTPASTFQGMSEAGLQLYGMIFKRIWRCMKEEFKRRYEINRVFLRDHEGFGPGEDFIRREDYLGNPDLIAPVANPRLTSSFLRLQQATAVKQSAMGTPGYDIFEVENAWLDSMEVEGKERLYPGPGKVPQGHEMVNPVVQREMLKLQGIQMKEKSRQMEWANKLMEEKRKNNAQIKLLEAQAMKAVADAKAVGGEMAAMQIEAFESLIEAHTKYGEMLNQRIEALLGGEGGASDDGGRVGGVEKGQSDGERSGSVSLEVPGGSQVSVGGR